MFVPDDISDITPRGGPGVLGPWRTLTRGDRRPGPRAALAAASAIGAATVIAHCILPLI
ncbi:hypothetical protein [Psychromarinibacter sp. S121]|uniref:hypothetical protein n=1 Tax=Psychromarinibacter sp. S121 TaxID=3415127 RepID=UPI003C7B3725